MVTSGWDREGPVFLRQLEVLPGILVDVGAGTCDMSEGKEWGPGSPAPDSTGKPL